MKTDAHGATGEAMPTITRRAVLTTGAAAMAMSPASVALAGTSEISQELSNLIAKNASAVAAWKETIDPQEEAEKAWKAHVKDQPLPMVPYFGGRLDAGVFDRDDMVSQIIQIFHGQRDNMRAFEKMDPATANTMAAVLRTQQEETLAAAHRIHDEIDRRKEAFGLTAARQAYETTCDAHENALWDLLEYDAVTLAEERARAAAILAEPISYHLVMTDDRFSSAFLHTVAGIDMPGGEA